MTTFNTLRAAQGRMAEAGGEPLGSLLWWSLNGNRIEHDQLLNLASQFGLPERHLPKEIKPTQAFRRGWRHASTKLVDGQMLRPIAETTDEVVVGLVQESVDEKTRELEYGLLNRITFDKHAAAITSEREGIVTESIRTLFRHHLAHTSKDIRSMLTSFLSEAGVSLRESGGVYYVPANYQDTLEALCSVVEGAGNNSTFQLPIVDTPAGRSALRTVAQRNLDDEVRQLQEELERFDDDKVRSSTLERKLEAFGDLRSRVDLFARVLSFKADDLRSKIGVTQAALRARLGVDEREPPMRAAPDVGRPKAVIPPAPYAADVGF